MTVRAILSQREGDVVAVGRDTPVAEAVRLLAERRIGAVPVVEGDRVIGIFSERDVIYGLAMGGATTLDRLVGEAMTSPAMTVERDAPVMAALSLMTRRRIRHLPVVEDGRMVGFISIGDLVKYRIDRIEAEAEALKEYIAG